MQIYRYVVPNSIEERMLQLHERKRRLMSAAFVRAAENARAQRLEDVRLLMDLDG